MHSSKPQNLATLAREAHARMERDAAAELHVRVATREAEIGNAAFSHLRNVLGLDVSDVTVIEQVHAEPFDTLGGWARMDVDGITIVYTWPGPHQAPTLTVDGEAFDSLAGLGEALARSEPSTTETAGITTYGREDK